MSGDSISDRLTSLSRGELIGLSVLVALTLAGAGVWYARSLPRPVEVRAERPPEVIAAPTPSPAVLLVHVAGWVRDPGVFEFREGDRVIDAVQAAGGPRRGAALDALNLAALLVDGSQVVVPKRVAGVPAGPSAAVGGVAPGAGALINVNTASPTQLEELPGIGPVLAQAIIDHRTENGPFTSVDQLDDVSGIGPVTLENIRDLVTV